MGEPGQERAERHRRRQPRRRAEESDRAAVSSVIDNVGDDHQADQAHADEAPDVFTQDRQAEQELQRDAPQDRAQPHPPPVIGEQPAHTEQQNQAGYADQAQAV